MGRREIGSDKHQQLAYIILVELLAYQFASPVCWIRTQDLLFMHYTFQRLIEVGPSPTLTGMVMSILEAKYERIDGFLSKIRAILCHSKNGKEIYYQYEDAVKAPVFDDPDNSLAPALVPVVAIPTAAPSTSGSALSNEDVPISAIDVHVIIAQKLKKKVNEIPISKTIKDLVGGKSTMQDEILGNLQQEFAPAPEKAEELLCLRNLVLLGTGFGGNLGKYSTGLMSRLVGGKMPGGFNASTIKISCETWGLGPIRSDAVLLLATTVEPPKRLLSEAEAKSWFDNVVFIYSQHAGVRLGSTGTGGFEQQGTYSHQYYQPMQATHGLCIAHTHAEPPHS